MFSPLHGFMCCPYKHKKQFFSVTSVHEYFCLQIIWFTNRSIWQNFDFVRKLCIDHGHLSHRNKNMAIFSKTVEQIKFLNWGSIVLKTLQKAASFNTGSKTL